MSDVEQVGWIVERYDPEGDDRRGAWSEFEFWLEKSEAQRRVDDLNTEALRAENERRSKLREAEEKRYTLEMARSLALRAAGFPESLPERRDPTYWQQLSELTRWQEQYTLTPIEWVGFQK